MIKSKKRLIAIAVLCVVTLLSAFTLVPEKKAQASDPFSDYYVDVYTGLNFTGTRVRLYVSQSYTQVPASVYKNIKSIKCYNDTWVFMFSQNNFRGTSSWLGWQALDGPSVDGASVDIGDVNGCWRDNQISDSMNINWQTNIASMVIFVAGSDQWQNPTLATRAEYQVFALEYDGYGREINRKQLQVKSYYQYWGIAEDARYTAYRLDYPVMSGESSHGSPVMQNIQVWDVSPGNPGKFFVMKGKYLTSGGNLVNKYVCADRNAPNGGVNRPLCAKSDNFGPWETFQFTWKQTTSVPGEFYAKFACCDLVRQVDQEIAGNDNYYPQSLYDYYDPNNPDGVYQINLHYASPVTHYWYNQAPPTSSKFLFSPSGM
jgi:hypothetical protein